MPLNNPSPALPVNLIINGDCQVNQNGVATTDLDMNTADKTLRQVAFPNLDNFGITTETAFNATVRIGRAAGHPILGDSGNNAFIRAQTALAQGAIPAGSIFGAGFTMPVQRLNEEGGPQPQNYYTFQFSAMSTLPGIYTAYITSARSTPYLLYPFEIRILSANTWQTFTVGIPTYTDSTFFNLGAHLGVIMAAGANMRNGVMNAYNVNIPTPVRASANQVNFFATVGNVFRITDAIFTPAIGSIIYPRLSLSDSILRCQSLLWSTSPTTAFPPFPTDFNAGIKSKKNTAGATNVVFNCTMPQFMSNEIHNIEIYSGLGGANTGQASNQSTFVDCTATAVLGPVNNSSRPSFTVVATGDVGSAVGDTFSVGLVVDGNTYFL